MRHGQLISQIGRWILIFIGIVWLVLLPVDLAQFGLAPRTLSGLVGIVTMSSLNCDFGHLLSNTVPLCVLLFLLAGTRNGSELVVVNVIMTGGALLWLFVCRGRIHVRPTV